MLTDPTGPVTPIHRKRMVQPMFLLALLLLPEQAQFKLLANNCIVDKFHSAGYIRLATTAERSQTPDVSPKRQGSAHRPYLLLLVRNARQQRPQDVRIVRHEVVLPQLHELVHLPRHAHKR